MPSKCSKGQIWRVGYKRKAYTRADGTRVHAVNVKGGCIIDRGAPGKGPKILPKPVKGNLGKYGYSTFVSAAQRRTALKKAVQATTYATIVRRLNLVANFTKVSDPRAHKIYRSDMAWMKKVLAPKYSLTAKRAAAKKRSRKVSRKPSKKRVSRKHKVSKKVSRKRRVSKKVGPKERKVGTYKKRDGRTVTLYRRGTGPKFYKYRKAAGGMGKRYVK